MGRSRQKTSRQRLTVIVMRLLKALASLDLTKQFDICVDFIKTGGKDGKGTGAPNGLGQGQEGRQTLYKVRVPLPIQSGPAFGTAGRAARRANLAPLPLTPALVRRKAGI